MLAGSQVNKRCIFENQGPWNMKVKLGDSVRSSIHQSWIRCTCIRNPGSMPRIGQFEGKLVLLFLLCWKRRKRRGKNIDNNKIQQAIWNVFSEGGSALDLYKLLGLRYCLIWFKWSRLSLFLL